MLIYEVILLMLMLQVKHLVVDWCWQPAYEWKNKGTYGHLGGIRHALKNAIGTGLCFWIFVPLPLALIVMVLDGVIHYHVDYCKMNINARKGWGPTTHNEFWWLTGADQFAHQVCYIFLIALTLVIWS